jgi:hypothetical protein
MRTRQRRATEIVRCCPSLMAVSHSWPWRAPRHGSRAMCGAMSPPCWLGYRSPLPAYGRWRRAHDGAKSHPLSQYCHRSSTGCLLEYTRQSHAAGDLGRHGCGVASLALGTDEKVETTERRPSTTIGAAVWPSIVGPRKCLCVGRATMGPAAHSPKDGGDVAKRGLECAGSRPAGRTRRRWSRAFSQIVPREVVRVPARPRHGGAQQSV